MWRPNWKQLLTILLGVYLCLGAPLTTVGFVGVAIIWTMTAGAVYWLETKKTEPGARND